MATVSSTVKAGSNTEGDRARVARPKSQLPRSHLLRSASWVEEATLDPSPFLPIDH